MFGEVLALGIGIVGMAVGLWKSVVSPGLVGIHSLVKVLSWVCLFKFSNFLELLFLNN